MTGEFSKNKKSNQTNLLLHENVLDLSSLILSEMFSDEDEDFPPINYSTPKPSTSGIYGSWDLEAQPDILDMLVIVLHRKTYVKVTSHFAGHLALFYI